MKCFCVSIVFHDEGEGQRAMHTSSVRLRGRGLLGLVLVTVFLVRAEAGLKLVEVVDEFLEERHGGDTCAVTWYSVGRLHCEFLGYFRGRDQSAPLRQLKAAYYGQLRETWTGTEAAVMTPGPLDTWRGLRCQWDWAPLPCHPAARRSIPSCRAPQSRNLAPDNALQHETGASLQLV